MIRIEDFKSVVAEIGDYPADFIPGEFEKRLVVFVVFNAPGADDAGRNLDAVHARLSYFASKIVNVGRVMLVHDQANSQVTFAAKFLEISYEDLRYI